MTDEAVLSVLTFEVGGVVAALELRWVREVVEYRAPTRVPGAPAFVAGVVNLRGSVLPVIELARHLGLPVAPPTKRSCLLVCEIAHREAMVLALVVDLVQDVLELPKASVRPAPPFGVPVRLDHLLGLVPGEHGLMLVLDAARVLGPDELDAAAKLDAPREANA